MIYNVIVEEADADKLLRILYNGRRPKRVHTLVCACGAIADLRQDPRAWNGWVVLPHPKCPTCRIAGQPVVTFQPEFPMRALVRFVHLVDLLVEKESVA